MNRCFPPLIIVLCAFLSLGVVWAQDTRASLLGRVTDSSGATVAGAQVRAANLATNSVVAAVSNGEGNYTIPYLLPGQYRLTVESSGFKAAVREPIELRSSERRTVDVALEIGATTESVLVKAEAPLLDQSTATVGMTIDGQRLADLPMVGGNPYYLSRISPGVSPGGRSAGNPFDYGSGQDPVNGTRGGSSEVSLDGSPNMFGRSTAFSLPEDLVQEMRVETAAYDAASGRAAGANINVNMKSGTNKLHGTAYLFDSRLRAVPWHTNRFIYDPTTGPITPEKIARNTPGWLHQRWGATASGPLVLPKLYNGRNRSFWSFGYEGLKIVRNLSFTGTMPTAEQRSGNFAPLVAAAGANYQIYDPLTTAPAAAGRFSRQPFPGNVIPPSRISPIARTIAPFWPEPNQPGSRDFRNNYFSTQNIDRNNRSLIGRVDHSISDRHRIFVRFNENYRNETTVLFPSPATGDRPSQPGYGAVLDDVYTFSPSLLLNVRYGWTYQKPVTERVTQGFDLTKLGFSSSLVQQLGNFNPVSSFTFPQVTIDGGAYTNLGHDSGSTTTNNYHSFGATLTKLAGSHNIRTGGEFRLLREGAYAFGNATPQFAFGSGFTNGPLDNAPGSPIGQGFAAFLLGQTTGGFVSVNASRAEQSTYSSLFLQDDWKISSKLTLNLGLRYEYEGPITERFNRSVRDFDFNTASPVNAQARAAYALAPAAELPLASFQVLGGLRFAGEGQARGFWAPDRNNFAPRIGLAYRLGTKTVIRTGYGIFFDVTGADRNNPLQSGYSQATNIVPTLDNGLTFIANLANPFPSGIDVPPGSSQGLNTFLGRSGSTISQVRPNPFNQRWSFTIQRQLPLRMVMEVGYVGNRGTQLQVDRSIDPLPRQYLSTSPERDQPVINLLTANLRNPFQNIEAFRGTAFFGANIARQQLLTSLPHFNGASISVPAGYSYYHSLQAQIEKRFSNGLTFQAAYTHSKFMEAISYLEPTDSQLHKVISDLDRPHRFVVSGVYQLPVGRGRAFGKQLNRFVDGIVGGWQVESMYEVQQGDPLGFGNAIFRGNLKDIALPASQRGNDRWFNTGAGFERNNANRLEWNLRTLPLRFAGVRAPGLNNLDSSLAKNFRISERYTAQFRMESYNALNHVQLGAPNTDPFNTNFGVITGENGHGQRQVTFALKLIF